LLGTNQNLRMGPENLVLFVGRKNVLENNSPLIF
jgi:hypothetical protein